MKETEVKILNINPEKIRKIILKNNGEKIKKVFQIDSVYKNSITKKKDVHVRIRQEKKNFWLTIKSPKKILNNCKVLDEYEMKIKNFQFGDEMLKLLGFKKTRIRECQREYFKMQNCNVEIIKMKNFPYFLEIEGSQKNILNIVKIFGYSKKDCVPKSIYEILRETRQIS